MYLGIRGYRVRNIWQRNLRFLFVLAVTYNVNIDFYGGVRVFLKSSSIHGFESLFSMAVSVFCKVVCSVRQVRHQYDIGMKREHHEIH